MIIENLYMTRLIDSLYRNEIQKADDRIIYCEIQYQRDRSSFAGMAFKINNKKDVIVIKKCEEKNIGDISKYEKLYIGCEQDYIDSIKELFSLEVREYGIEVFFLVYSDVRSSKMIFEDLMKGVNNNIKLIRDCCG